MNINLDDFLNITYKFSDQVSHGYYRSYRELLKFDSPVIKNKKFIQDIKHLEITEKLI